MADHGNETGQDTQMTTCEAPLRQARVLLIDGEDGTRFRVACDLKRAGASVDLACDSETALAAIGDAQDAGEPFDLVMLDLSTLGRGGYEIIESLREAQFVGPVVALTQRKAERQLGRCRKAGCDDLICKSDDPSAMIGRAAELIAEEKARRYGLAQPEDVISELSGYPELLMMLRQFVSNLPNTVDSMLGAQREQDVNRLMEELDRIKRNATSHGYTTIRASAVLAHKTLEQRKKADDHQVVDALNELVDLCRRATVQPGSPPPPKGPPLPPSG